MARKNITAENLRKLKAGDFIYYRDSLTGYTILGASSRYIVTSRRLDPLADEYYIRRYRERHPSKPMPAFKFRIIDIVNDLAGEMDTVAYYRLELPRNLIKGLRQLDQGKVTLKNTKKDTILKEATFENI